MYRIHWISRLTIITGHGDYCLTYSQAMAWKEYLDDRYPYILHTVESNQDVQLPQPDQEPLPNLLS